MSYTDRGAAGTSKCNDILDDDNVVFPAEMDEVMAVTALEYPGGYVPCGAHHWPEVDLAAYHNQPTSSVTFTAMVYIGSGQFSYQWSSGETSSSITRAIDSGSGSFDVSVTVTDLATGESRTSSKFVYVWYEESCETCLQEGG
ncbi:MAG: hypothetical protein M3483_01115 [Gemmatimonadota bacterium]|nr:hypothetical protein [Gemmatimonadota bacterium]